LSVGEQEPKDLQLFEPKVKSINPSNEHLAQIRGEGSFPPKLLLISTILAKFS